MPWHFLSFVLTHCLLGSVGGHSRCTTDLWIVIASLCSYHKYIKGNTSSPKRKRKYSDHASKKSARKKKRSKLDQPPSIPYPHVSEDNIGADLDAPTSPPKLSYLEGPSNHVSLVDYDSNEDHDQDGEKQSELEDLTKSSPLQDNQDDDTSMQTVDIPSSEGVIVDDEPNDMSIVLRSTHLPRHLALILMINLPYLKKIPKTRMILNK
ncbi:unnamed protein product [Lactuca saligna]|uniref:Uncharacterized protein n=1 Tax=Lactuca saligna TaxID=75948 RepID=A0AA35Z7H1_LACSI|nr:unnamed protein product [Lactuca saligna]